MTAMIGSPSRVMRAPKSETVWAAHRRRKSRSRQRGDRDDIKGSCGWARPYGRGPAQGAGTAGERILSRRRRLTWAGSCRPAFGKSSLRQEGGDLPVAAQPYVARVRAMGLQHRQQLGRGLGVVGPDVAVE